MSKVKSPSRKRLLGGLLALTLVLAACAGAAETFSEIGGGLGGDGDGFVSNSGGEEAVGSPSPPTTVAAATAEDGEGKSDPLGRGGVLPVSFDVAAFGRDIIFTADMTVAVTDVAAAGEEATRIIESLGGFLFGQSTQGSPNPRSVLTFKVDPKDFQEALARLGSLGDVRTQDVSANDVTDRIVDLESQIETAAASVERLRALLSEATDIKSIVELENELLARETQLESLRGQLRTLQNQVALATISVTLTEAESQPQLELVVSSYTGHDDGVSCPGDIEARIEQGADATVCFEIVNTGDTLLTDFELRDPVLDIETGDLVVVYGDPETAIEPGESIVLAAEIVADRSMTTRTTVTAQAVNDDGDPIGDRAVTQTSSSYISAVDPGGVPTFTEGLQASWDWLVSFGQVLLLGVGALIPFFWVPLLAWFLWRMRKSRKAEPVTASTEEG